MECRYDFFQFEERVLANVNTGKFGFNAFEHVAYQVSGAGETMRRERVREGREMTLAKSGHKPELWPYP